MSEEKEESPPDMVMEVIGNYPNSLCSEEIQFGGTPLHWATDKPFIDALIKVGCCLEERNSVGNTALHVMVRHTRLECLLCLLCHGAEVNSPDVKGNTPLHLAVSGGHIPSIQAMIVFGADFNIKNVAGETPWTTALKAHENGEAGILRNILFTLHEVGAQDPSDQMTGSSEDDSEHGPGHVKKLPQDVGSTHLESPPTDTSPIILRQRYRHLMDELLDSDARVAEVTPGSLSVLSLDGGGIRGLVLSKILHCITQEADQAVTDLFSWIAGTSTGGIIALLLASGKSPMECLRRYFQIKDTVFEGGPRPVRSRPYDENPLEDCLKEDFPETMMMKDLPQKPYIAITGVLADRFPADLHFFRNYESPMELLGMELDTFFKKPDQQSVWEAARSSGAAPTYFKKYGQFVDGGLIANNPTLDILTEIQEYNFALQHRDPKAEPQKVGLVVSLGTGETPEEEVDSVGLNWSGAENLTRLLVGLATGTTPRVVDRARAWCNMAGIKYFSFNPPLAQRIFLDETNDEVLLEMLWTTQAYMHQHRGKVQELIEVLRKLQDKSSCLIG